ncbi:MAG TPA: TonB-dependent receptor [Croceibacterium sp.]|nr:TonB-dependent receptor [Croceibacterium sp.]
MRTMFSGGVAVAAIAVSMVALNAPAHAQEAASASRPAESEAEGPAIIVTGSRIVRQDYVASSPLVTIGQEQFVTQAGTTVETVLNKLPQFSAAGTASTASSSGGSATGADKALGAATLDLRGLGTNRTLVLVNGRRAQPVNAMLVVDTNTIPISALRNVEVITGGAASTYGADAIAGVVNFLLKDDYEGFEINSHLGISEHGDGEQYQVSALLGGNFADDRGNVMISANWSDRAETYQRNRGFYTDAWKDPNTPGTGNGVPITTVTLAGVNYSINPDGSLFRADDVLNPAAPYTGPLGDLAGGAGIKLSSALSPTGKRTLTYNYHDAWATLPLTRWSIFASGHYDVTDDITFYVDGNYNHTKAVVQSVAGQGGSGFWNVNVPYNAANDDPDSPTFGADTSNWHPVSAQLADALNALSPVPTTWALTRGYNFAGRIVNNINTDVYQVTAGLKGKVGVKDWTWDIYGSHGGTSILSQQPTGAISLANMQQIVNGTVAGGALSPTVNGPYGQNWSSGALFNPKTCSSGIPIFDANGNVASPQGGSSLDAMTLSQDCLDYITLELNSATRVTQNIGELNLQGALFDNWAGEIRFAAGASYRSNKFSYVPDSGISGEQPGLGVIGQIVLPNQVEGETIAKEAYGELLVPVLKDLPLIQQLNLELGARYSSYNYGGSSTTFKVMADWTVTDFLRLRGGFQRANRAPNVYELFAPLSAGIASSHDACTNLSNGLTPEYGNLESNPNQVNVQVACQTLMIRSGAYPYVTLADDPTAVAEPTAGYPAIDLTRMSNFRFALTPYGTGYGFSVGLNQGNTGLKSESADTITIGAVIRSPFEAAALRRLNITADYYSIKLSDAIGLPTGDEVYSQCFDPANNPLMSSAAGSLTGDELLAGNPYCAYIQRYPFNDDGIRGAVGSGADRTFIAPFVNKGKLETSGIDATFDWTADLEDLGLGVPGAINLNVSGNLLLSYKQQSIAGGAVLDLKGTAQNLAFDYKVYTTVSYLSDGVSMGVRWFHLPSIDPAPTAAPGTTGAKAHDELSLFATYKLTDSVEVGAGIENLLNARPEIFGATSTNSNSGVTLTPYDVVGRSFYLNAKVRL